MIRKKVENLKKEPVSGKRDLRGYWETVLWRQVWIAGRKETLATNSQTTRNDYKHDPN